jgi:oligopeptide/dipeptide ABC transporter ATP-binding protein
MALLEVEDLAVRFHTRSGVVRAVDGVSFAIEAGETVGLVGESGSGKSVTSLALMGLVGGRRTEVSAARMSLDGVQLLSLSPSELRRHRGRDLAMVFQNPSTSLNPVVTISKQVVEALQAHAPIGRAKARERARELLAQVGISDPDRVLEAYPHRLSGGMCQRVMIAIALALRPKLLIADEPTTALDVTIQAQVLEVLRDLTREAGTAVMLITHDLGVVASMAQRVNVMYAGRVVETAATADIFARPRHPYTVGLLRSIARSDRDEGAPLVPIPGQPPDPHSHSSGCPFAPRCAWRLDRCVIEAPLLTAAPESGPGQLFACHNPVTTDEAAAGRPLPPRAASGAAE